MQLHIISKSFVVEAPIYFCLYWGYDVLEGQNWIIGYFSKRFNFKDLSISFLVSKCPLKLLLIERKPITCVNWVWRMHFFRKPSSTQISRKSKLNFESSKKKFVEAHLLFEKNNISFEEGEKCKQTADHRVNNTKHCVDFLGKCTWRFEPYWIYETSGIVSNVVKIS